MRRYVAIIVIAILSEIIALWWRWARSPTDSLQAWYQGEFFAYLADWLVPWLVIFATLVSLLLIFKRRAKTQ